MVLRICLLVFIFFSCHLSAEPKSPWKLVVPYDVSEENSTWVSYGKEVLKLAFKQQGIPLTIVDTTLIKQQRAVDMLARGDTLDLLWTMTSHEREKRLLPVRIPIFKGVIGYRIAMIRRESQQKFNQLLTQQEMKSYIALQGHDWPDYTILKHNEFKVEPNANYQSAFKMLVEGLADYFPRGAMEIHDDMKNYGHLGLQIEEKHLIYYPTAAYFFVNKNNEALASIIEKGLLMAIENGAFDAVFQRHFNQRLDKLNLNNRIVHKLENPLLPIDTPLNNSKLWFTFTK